MVSIVITGIVGFVSILLATIVLAGANTKPVEMLEHVISYAAHNNRQQVAPNPEELRLGRELVTAQSLQIYNLVSGQSNIHSQNPDNTQVDGPSLFDSIATPLFGVNAEQIVTIVNKAAAVYLGKPVEEILGKPLFDSLRLSFQGDVSYAEWLESAKGSSVTATKSWNRVRHVIDADNSKQFDMVASFSSGAQSGTDSMILLFDKTELYGKDDQDISFVALAVHELRTPLTLMRGYIEVFEDELGPSLSPTSRVHA
jgi:signal transduction histidine kinase